MRIIDLDRANIDHLEQVAEILQGSFRGLCPDYEQIELARVRVLESFEDHQLSRVAIEDDGFILGWIAGISMYRGNVWEIDPLAVRVGYQRKGVGRRLVEDFESTVASLGGITIWLGTDDESGRTSLSGRNLYPDVLGKARAIEDAGGHPFKFYQHLGFEVVGLLPDANGPGKPDIYMAKRVAGVPDPSLP